MEPRQKQDVVGVGVPYARYALLVQDERLDRASSPPDHLAELVPLDVDGVRTELRAHIVRAELALWHVVHEPEPPETERERRPIVEEEHHLSLFRKLVSRNDRGLGAHPEVQDDEALLHAAGTG